MNSNEEDKDNQHHGCGRRRLWKIPFIVAAIVLIKSVVVMVIWNFLIPDLFHGPTLTYVQAIGLSILAKLLVGFGPRHFGGGPFGRFGGWGGGHLHRHWAKLSPEEREKMRDTLRNQM